MAKCITYDGDEIMVHAIVSVDNKKKLRVEKVEMVFLPKKSINNLWMNPIQSNTKERTTE